MAGKNVLERVMEWARREDTVGAVLIGGSRAADLDGVDALSDYDVMLVLSEPGTLAADADWTERFGVASTMAGAEPSEHWDALMATTRVFRRAMKSVAADVGVSYPDDLDRDVCERLEELRRGDVESG